jgi:hypothetical protein
MFATQTWLGAQMPDLPGVETNSAGADLRWAQLAWREPVRCSCGIHAGLSSFEPVADCRSWSMASRS